MSPIYVPQPQPQPQPAFQQPQYEVRPKFTYVPQQTQRQPPQYPPAFNPYINPPPFNPASIPYTHQQGVGGPGYYAPNA